MANILDAAAQGTRNTVAGAARTAKEAVMDQFDPRKSIYGLGLGVGPLIRQTVLEYKKQSAKDKKDGTQQQKKLTEIKKTGDAGNKSLQRTVAQLSSMNSLLKEIHKINIAQLQAQRSFNKGQRGNINRSAFRNSNDPTDQKIISSSMVDRDDIVGKKADPGGNSLEGIGTLIKIVAGGLAAGEIWKMLPPDMKKDVQQGAKAIDDVVIKTTTDMWKSAFEAAPVTTALGTIFLAKISGVLDVALAAARVATTTGKAAYNVGKFITQPLPSATTAVETSTRVPTAPIAQAPGIANTIRRTLGMEQQLVNASKESADIGTKTGIKAAAQEYKELAKSTTTQYANETFAKRYGDRGLEAVKNVANPVTPTAAATATEAAKSGEAAAATATSTSKIAATFGKVVGVASKALGVLGVAGSGYSAYENYNAGNKKLAALDAISATTGGLALAAGATGIGAPVAAALGGVSLITGLASMVGSRFVDNQSSNVQPQQDTAGNKAASNASQQEMKAVIEEVFRSKGFGENQIKAAQIVAAAESGLNPSARNTSGGEDSVGLFQLNRKGGEGTPYTVQQLLDPKFNAGVAAGKMSGKQGDAFRNAKSVEEAVAALTRDFERPHFVKGGSIVDSKAFAAYAARGSNIVGGSIDGTALASAATATGTSLASSSAIQATDLKNMGLASDQIAAVTEFQKAIKGFEGGGMFDSDINSLMQAFAAATSAAPTNAAPSGGSNKTPPSVPPVSMYKEKHSFGQAKAPWYASGGSMPSFT